MIARYLVQRMGFSVSDALECITVARGHPIEREHYISNLGMNAQLLPKLADGRDILRGRAEGDSQRVNKRPTVDKGKEHVKRHGLSRDNFHGSREAWNDPSKNMAPWETGRGPQTGFSEPREDGIRRPRRSEFIDEPIFPHEQIGNWGSSAVPPALHPAGSQNPLGPRFSEPSSNNFIPERRNDYRNEGRRTELPGFDPRVPPPLFPQRDLTVGNLEFGGRRPQRSEFVDDHHGDPPGGLHQGNEDRGFHHQRLPPREWHGPPSDRDNFGRPPHRMSPQRGRPRSPHTERANSPRRRFSPSPGRGSPVHRRPSPHRNQRMSPFHGRRMSSPQGRRMSPPRGRGMSPPHGRRMSPPHGRRMSPPHGRRLSPPHSRRTSPPHNRRISPHQGHRIHPPNDRRLSPPSLGSRMSPPPPPRTLRPPPPPVRQMSPHMPRLSPPRRFVSPPQNIRPPSPRGHPATPPFTSHHTHEPFRDHLDMKYGLDIEPFPLARSPPRRPVLRDNESEQRCTLNHPPGPGRFRRSRSPVRRRTPRREQSPSRKSPPPGVRPRQAFQNSTHAIDKGIKSPSSLQPGKFRKDVTPLQEKNSRKRIDPPHFEHGSSKQYDDQRGKRGLEGRQQTNYSNDRKTTLLDYNDLRSGSITPPRNSSLSKSCDDRLKSDLRRGCSKTSDVQKRSGPRSPKRPDDLKRPRPKSPEENDEVKRRRPGTPTKHGKPTSETQREGRVEKRVPDSHLGSNRGRKPEYHETKSGRRTSDLEKELRRERRTSDGPRREQRTFKPHVGPRDERRSPEPQSGPRLRQVTPELEIERMHKQRSLDSQFESRRGLPDPDLSMGPRSRYVPSELPVENYHEQSISPEPFRGPTGSERTERIGRRMQVMSHSRSGTITPEPSEDPRQYEMRTTDYEKQSFHTEEPLEYAEELDRYEELPRMTGDRRNSGLLRAPQPLLEDDDRRPNRDYGHHWNRGGSFRGTRRPYRGQSMRGSRGRGGQHFHGPTTPEGPGGRSFAEPYPDNSPVDLEQLPDEFPDFPIYAKSGSRPALFNEPEVTDSFVEDEPDCRELLIEKRITTVTEEMKALSPTALDLIGPDDEILFIGSNSDRTGRSSSIHRRPISSRLSQRLPGRSCSPPVKKHVFERLDEKKPPVFERLDNPPFHNIEEPDIPVHDEIEHSVEPSFENQFSRGRGRNSSPHARFTQPNRGFRGMRSSSRGMYSSSRGMRPFSREMNPSYRGMRSSNEEMRPPLRGMHSSFRGTGLNSRGNYSSTRSARTSSGSISPPTRMASTNQVTQHTTRPHNASEKTPQGSFPLMKNVVPPPAGVRVPKKTTTASSGTSKLIKKVSTTSKEGVRGLKKVPSSSSEGASILKKAPSSLSKGVRVIKRAPGSSPAMGVAKKTTSPTSQGVRQATKAVKATGKVGTTAKGASGVKVKTKIIRKPLERGRGAAALIDRK